MITNRSTPGLWFIVGLIFFCMMGQASADTKSSTNKFHCQPQVHFISGLWQKDGPVKAIYNHLKSAYEKAGVKTELHSHWQGDDWGKADAYCGTTGVACIFVSSIFFPPAIFGCPVVDVGCRETANRLTGDLIKSLKMGLKNKKNPIILVGYSWGGDTAYESGNYLASLITTDNHNGYDPRIAVVTLDAVGKPRKRNKQFRGGWLNIHVNQDVPDFNQCRGGNVIMRTGKTFGTKAYRHEKGATRNINANKNSQSDLNHCSAVEMFTLAQNFIEDQIRSSCGDFELPKMYLK